RARRCARVRVRTQLRHPPQVPLPQPGLMGALGAEAAIWAVLGPAACGHNPPTPSESGLGHSRRKRSEPVANACPQYAKSGQLADRLGMSALCHVWTATAMQGKRI